MSSTKNLLCLQDVSFCVNQQTLLSPTSFTLNSGEFCLLTGPSGSGKSTLLKIIASLLTPTAGKVFFEQQDILLIKPELYRQQVSYCFQTPVLFGNTVLDNLSLPYQIRNKKVNREELTKWLTRVNLPASLLDKNIAELSGGEKQRVSLLRNLQFLPKVLLLDEITSALDEENKKNINALIADLVNKHDLAVIWVSHDTNEIDHAQRVIRLTANHNGENTNE